MPIYVTKELFKTDMYNNYTKVLTEKKIDLEFAKYLVSQDALESN